MALDVERLKFDKRQRTQSRLDEMMLYDISVSFQRLCRNVGLGVIPEPLFQVLFYAQSRWWNITASLDLVQQAVQLALSLCSASVGNGICGYYFKL